MLYIDREKYEENKRIFDHLHSEKERIESVFGGPLIWERMDDKKASRIKWICDRGGWADEEKWDEIQDLLIDAMIRLDKAMSPHISSLP